MRARVGVCVGVVVWEGGLGRRVLVSAKRIAPFSQVNTASRSMARLACVLSTTDFTGWLCPKMAWWEYIALCRQH